MDALADLTSFVLVIIAGGAGARLLYCVVMLGIDNDEDKSYRIRIRNLLVFLAIALTATRIIQLIKSYF